MRRDTIPAWEGTEATKQVDISTWNTQRLLPQCLTALLSYCQKLSHSEMFQDRTIFYVSSLCSNPNAGDGALERIDYGQML